MTTEPHTAGGLDALLRAALDDTDMLDHLTLGELATLHDHIGGRLADLYDDLPPGMYTTATIDEIGLVGARCWTLLATKRPWTVYTTCTGSATWWVAGGETEAAERFTRWLGRSPWDRCEQCVDSNWHEVDVPYNADPPEDANVITDDDVAGSADLE